MPRDTRTKDRKETPAKSLAPRQAPAPEPPPEEPLGPRVSAILVVFNQAAALRRAVEALERSEGR